MVYDGITSMILNICLVICIWVNHSYMVENKYIILYINMFVYYDFPFSVSIHIYIYMGKL